eukprot:TRINITY_DN422_c0_g1_i2.p1 TRINITY_DN422_c0_g1~~TRINITY_DN422_c0_g1_i2.p1  ORF type:complete len:355 (-),score=20.54 TRINITY_DN422_c0_g1_i2:565-1629(-)
MGVFTNMDKSEKIYNIVWFSAYLALSISSLWFIIYLKRHKYLHSSPRACLFTILAWSTFRNFEYSARLITSLYGHDTETIDVMFRSGTFILSELLMNLLCFYWMAWWMDFMSHTNLISRRWRQKKGLFIKVFIGVQATFFILDQVSVCMGVGSKEIWQITFTYISLTCVAIILMLSGISVKLKGLVKSLKRSQADAKVTKKTVRLFNYFFLSSIACIICFSFHTVFMCRNSYYLFQYSCLPAQKSGELKSQFYCNPLELLHAFNTCEILPGVFMLLIIMHVVTVPKTRKRVNGDSQTVTSTVANPIQMVRLHKMKENMDESEIQQFRAVEMSTICARPSTLSYKPTDTSEFDYL